jgi:hypothetical protein
VQRLITTVNCHNHAVSDSFLQFNIVSHLVMLYKKEISKEKQLSCKTTVSEMNYMGT